MPFEPDKISELCKACLPQDVLADIDSYSDKMTISQVVRFFERRGVEFTKTMLQNYVRVNVLPPPVNKRYYTKNHLILLTIINHLKGVYSLEVIKQLLQPVVAMSVSDGDMLNMNALYDIYFKLYKATADNFEAAVPAIMDDVAKTVAENGGISADKKEAAERFMVVAAVMLQSTVAKQLAKSLLEN